MRPELAKDSAIASLAGAQHGVVSRSQFLVLGFTNADVTRRVRAARLHRVHHGLYAVGDSLKGRRALEQAVNRAERLVDFAQLRESAPASLQAVLSRYGTHATRSELEERFLRLCDDHGIPRPETNATIDGYEVDFVWRDRRLIVEVDGYAYHRSPRAFEADRERDVVLKMRGWDVRRFTHDHVTRRPAWVAAALATGA